MANTPRLRVLIADDYAPMLASLERIVSLECDVVGRLTDGQTLIVETRRLQPDVLLLDLNLPNVDTLWACREIGRTTPRTRVIVLTGGLDSYIRRAVLAAGASAFIDKSAASEELIAAITDPQPRES